MRGTARPRCILVLRAKIILLWKTDFIPWELRDISPQLAPPLTAPHRPHCLIFNFALYDKVTFLWTSGVSVISLSIKLVLSQMPVIPVVKLLHVMLQGLYSIQQSNRNNTLHSIKCEIFSDTLVIEWRPKNMCLLRFLAVLIAKWAQLGGDWLAKCQYCVNILIILSEWNI